MEQIINNIEPKGKIKNSYANNFIENFKMILPYILKEKENLNKINNKKIEENLNKLYLKGSPNKAKEKLIEYIQNGEEINFFIPWGFRYYTDDMNIDKQSLEYKSLEDLKNKLLILKELGVKFKLNFMYADSYATDINNCDVNMVNKYYSNLKNILLHLFGNNLNYDVFNYSEMTKGEIYKNFELDESIISDRQREKLEKQAKTLGSDWKEYVKNRQFEGMYVDKFLKNSIKISFASQMDDEFDIELSSLYITEKELQKPWAKIKS